MWTLSETDLEALSRAGVTLTDRDGVEDCGLRAGLRGANPVQVQVIDLGVETMAHELRGYWFQVIHRTASLHEPGLQRILESVDLGGACVLVVPPTVSFTQYVTSTGGTAGPVIAAVRSLSLAMIALASQGLATADLTLDDVCVTGEGVAQIRVTTELIVQAETGHYDFDGAGTRRLGLVDQLLKLIRDLRAQDLVPPHAIAGLKTILTKIVALPGGANAVGEVVVAVDKLQAGEGAAADLVRPAPSTGRLARVVNLVRGSRTNLALLGAGSLVLILGVVLAWGPVMERAAQPDLGAQEDRASVGETRSQEIELAATDLVKRRFDLISQITLGRADPSTIAQVVAADSGAHTQFTDLLTYLTENHIEVTSAQVTVQEIEIVADHGAEATVRLRYLVSQDQRRGGQPVDPAVLLESAQLDLIQSEGGWRMLDAKVIVF